ncbi:diguanylate cyclase domain-containing protein [Porticoccus sp.]|uniref:diguanylate cyclase domain-containing protein n=1 Tax=Porticoccus sp. TaxID=2024853 RepID=UPI003F6A12AD
MELDIDTEASLSSCIDLLLDAICVVDSAGKFVYVSGGGKRIFGYTPQEMIGKSMIDLVLPEDRDRTLQTAREIMSGRHEPYFENRYVRKNGQIVHIMWSARWSESDQLRIAVARDITKRKRIEARQVALFAISEAAHAAEDLPTLFEQIHQIIETLLPAASFSIAFYDDANDEVSFPYHADKQVLPSAIDSTVHCTKVIRSGETLLLSPEDINELPGLADTASSWLGVPLKSQRGTIGAMAVSSHPDNPHYSEDDRELLQFVSTQTAAAIERKQLLDHLQHMALYDQLTDLPNRALFQDRIQSALSRARRDSQRLSVLYLDLNKFKFINDNYGHLVGVLLLKEVARRLEGCVRECDTVSRFGGDEFVILLENIALPENTATIVDKIHQTLNEPFFLTGFKIGILPSIGVAHFPEDGNDETELLRHADHTMYQTKKSIP